MIPRVLVSVVVAAGWCAAQLTTDQRTADFRYLADLVARKYAPYEWKRDALKFDALNLAPWLQRIRAAKDDLEFYEICIEYLSALNDPHVTFYVPSSFIARLGFTTDVYEGKLLIDTIDRNRLPAEEFPFEPGDELVSVDGKSSQDLLSSISKLVVAGNSRSTQRYAATFVTIRPQTLLPRAHEIGDEAKILVRRQDGSEQTYSVPWRKTGLPLEVVGPGPAPRAAKSGEPAAARTEGTGLDRWLRKLENYRLRGPRLVAGVGAVAPVFKLPENFVQRLGRSRSDSFYSGTFESGGLRIGYIRIPSFEFPSLRAFETEIKFFEENTDGLIVDVMRNPGGFACSAVEPLLRRLIPVNFPGGTHELRVTWIEIVDLYDAIEEERAAESPRFEEIERLEALLSEYRSTYAGSRSRTPPMPMCSTTLEREPARDSAGNMVAYTKPLMVLVDEITASAAEMFASMIQDNRRGLVFGMRTMGAGGSPVPYEAGAYAEGQVDLTISLITRKDPVTTPDFPAAPYLENVGVRPDITADYMTKDNLKNQGQAFVEAFSKAIVEHIQKQRQQ